MNMLYTLKGLSLSIALMITHLRATQRQLPNMRSVRSHSVTCHPTQVIVPHL